MGRSDFTLVALLRDAKASKSVISFCLFEHDHTDSDLTAGVWSGLRGFMVSIYNK